MDPTSLPTTPAWASDLLAAVDRAFAATGADTPGWPDPHWDREPDEAEYSRCLDPGKYRILVRRLEAWIEVLADRDIATVSVGPWTGAAWLGADRSPDQLQRVYRIVPRTPRGLELLCGVTIVDEEPFGVDVGIRAGQVPASAPVFLDTLPSCGCDACDDGSAPLLEELDGWFLSVARGGVLHARRGGDSITRTIDGWQGTGDPRESWLDADARTRPGLERWAGEPWL
ncbi:DUF6226 family protein [Nocardioides sp. zg-DK7169]|uniref:DUF6226 family protein n=1 Tax=Nocardioides sp. zg-DK7169 TaxID=2736600 RepID=UPI0015558BFF|nr:hypothetical protein [Nocardioides sp. zg-DK7169]